MTGTIVDQKVYTKDEGMSIVTERDDINPGELTFEEGAQTTCQFRRNSLIYTVDTAGGMGRHLGTFSCTMLMWILSPFDFVDLCLSSEFI
jgi:hypothetical protein